MMMKQGKEKMGGMDEKKKGRMGGKVTYGNMNPHKAGAMAVGTEATGSPGMRHIKCIPGSGGFSKRTGYGTEGV
ncbi:MAG TPA: hypothetical protein ENJ90_05360 [Devosia sp.]|nr:hypothetical protein [Devosia sp.]